MRYDLDELKHNLWLLIISLVVTIALAIGSICLGGKVVCDMWNWFVTTATGWDNISYVVGVGLYVLFDGLFIANIVNQIKNAVQSYQDDNESYLTNIVLDLSGIIMLLLTWGVGAIIHRFM